MAPTLTGLRASAGAASRRGGCVRVDVAVRVRTPARRRVGPADDAALSSGDVVAGGSVLDRVG